MIQVVRDQQQFDLGNLTPILEPPTSKAAADVTGVSRE
jgi:hypothetical protein